MSCETMTTVQLAAIQLVERKLIRDAVVRIVVLFRDSKRNSRASTMHDLVREQAGLELSLFWDQTDYIRECFESLGIKSSLQNGMPVYRGLDIGDHVVSYAVKPLKRRRVKNITLS